MNMLHSFLTALLVLVALPAFAAPDDVRKIVLCDLNEDGFATTTLDYAVIIGAFQGSVPENTRAYRAADLDHSGAVTTADWGLMLEACPLGE